MLWRSIGIDKLASYLYLKKDILKMFQNFSLSKAKLVGTPLLAHFLLSSYLSLKIEVEKSLSRVLYAKIVPWAILM